MPLLFANTLRQIFSRRGPNYESVSSEIQYLFWHLLGYSYKILFPFLIPTPSTPGGDFLLYADKHCNKFRPRSGLRNRLQSYPACKELKVPLWLEKFCLHRRSYIIGHF